MLDILYRDESIYLHHIMPYFDAEVSSARNFLSNENILFFLLFLFVVSSGDGNCLPHAVSLYMWGVHDEQLFLRRRIHETLTDVATAAHFRSRWQHARCYLNSTIPEGGLRYDTQVW